jgi:imidazolonepropionase-like amidohydrolase
MLRLLTPFALVTLCALTFAANDRTGRLQGGVYVLRDATLRTDADSAPTRGHVVIRDGLIEDVGPDAKIPGDAVAIDAKGLTVTPGFIDALSNAGFDESLRRSAVGDPGKDELESDALAATKPDNRKGMTPEFVVRSALKVDADSLNEWRKIGVTARLVAPNGGIFVGQSAVVALSDVAPRATVLNDLFAQHLSFRTSGGAGDYPRVLMGVIAHTRQTLLDAAWHDRVVRAFEASGRKGKRPADDPALEALQQTLSGKHKLVIEADSADEIDRALDFAAEFGMKPIVYGGRDAHKRVERLKKENVALLLRVDFAEDDSPITRSAEKDMPARVREDRKKLREKERSCAAELAKAGVLFAFSAQGLTAEKFRGNVRKAIAAGLSADRALKALTSDAAKLLGVEGQIGSIAKGKAAHLVVADGEWDNAKTKTKMIFVDGLKYDPDPTAAPSGAIPTKGRTKGKGKDPTEAEKTEKTEKLDKPKEKDKGKDEADDVPATKADTHASEIVADRQISRKTGGNVLIKNATVLPISGPALKNADLEVKNGKIVRIGSKLNPGEGVTVVDATGLFVMPGIIDTHCHFAVSGGVNEFSLSIVPEVRIKDVISSEDVQIYRSLAGGVTTARLLHGSANVIGGQDAVIKLKYGATAKELLVETGPNGVKFALGENVKRTDGRFPNTRLGVEAVLVRAFSEAREYRKMQEAWKRNPVGVEPRRDLRLEALAEMLDNKLKIHCHCYRSDEILMLLRTCEKFGIKIASLQHVLEGYKAAPEIARHGASCSPFSDWWAYKWEAADAIPYCAALLHEAGVSVCLKSDSNELMRHMYQEAAKLLKYGGMSEQEALATITINGAKQLGLEKRIGTIELGKDGDLAIFNGHPLNAYSRVEMTLVEGEIFFERPDRKPFAAAAIAPPKPTPATNVLAGVNGKRLLLVDATVHPVSGPVQFKMTVEILDGKIADIRPSQAEDRKDKNAKLVTGTHIYPGMIDAATVLGLIEIDSARETIDYRESGDFQPDLRAVTGVNPDSELIPVTRANGVLSVVTRPTGGMIAGQSGLINLAGWTPKEMTVVDPLALHVELPGGVPGIGRGSPFGMAGAAVARRTRELKLKKLKDLFELAKIHDKARKDNPETPANPRLEALAPYALGQKAVVIQASRKDEIREAMQLADELKFKLIIAGGVDAWKVAEELKKRDVAVILGPVMTLPYENYDPYDAPFACAAKLHAAGVRFCIRSMGDSNTRNLPYHAAMAVSYGLPVEEGLKAVTKSAAEILGVGDRLGTIEKGKEANLVITTGDLLQPATQVIGLVIGGKAVDTTSKHTKLYERYRERLKEK